MTKENLLSREQQNKLVEMDNIIEQIQELEQEQEKLEAIYAAKQELLKFQYEQASNKCQKDIDNLKFLLKILAGQVPYKETKTQRKVKLLAGDVVIKKESKKIAHNDKKLLEWAIENKEEEYIKRKETLSFDYTSFKKDLKIDNDKIINLNTGEVVEIDGLGVETNLETLMIKYNAERTDANEQVQNR